MQRLLGTVGQVIRVWHDDERRERLAVTFGQWLDETVRELTGMEQQSK